MRSSVAHPFTHRPGAWKATAALGAAAVIALTVAQSGASSETRPRAAASPVTLVVQSGDGGETGLLAAYASLNTRFEAAHPGVKIDFVVKSFNDLTATLKLQLSGNTVPDVTEVNQGYQSLGELVTDGLVMNLDQIAKADDWSARQPADLLALDGDFAGGGKVMGSGSLWGISATATWVGLYENTDVAKQVGITSEPRTFTQLEADLAKAKAKGVIPLQFGSDDQAECSWLLGEILMAVASPKALLDVVDGTSTKLPSAMVTVGKVVQQWQADGYLTASSAAYSSGQVFNNFLAGKGLFVLSGTWAVPLPGSVASNAKFTLIPFPLARASSVAAIASGDLPWSIPTKAAHPALAAEYINYITSPAANATWIADGQAPASVSSDELADVAASHYTGTSAIAVTGWLKLLDKGTLAPYMDWSTPTFLTTIGSATQSLIADKDTPQSFVAALQADYGPFTSTR